MRSSKKEKSSFLGLRPLSVHGMQRMMTKSASRQRKTKEPCAQCFLHKDRCICAQIPSWTVASRLCLVIHARELKRTTNTGRLAATALKNSEMVVRGEADAPLDFSRILRDDYSSVLLYPADEARELDAEFVRSQAKPIQLIVPDGNWRQAGKVHYRYKELSHIPRVKLKNPKTSPYQLRLETVTEGMATLEAIAHAFSVLEGETVGSSLMALYRAKLRATLEGRGVSMPE